MTINHLGETWVGECPYGPDPGNTPVGGTFGKVSGSSLFWPPSRGIGAVVLYHSNVTVVDGVE